MTVASHRSTLNFVGSYHMIGFCIFSSSESSCCSVSSSAFVIVIALDFPYFYRNVVSSHCGFNLHFCNTIPYILYFHELIYQVYIFLAEHDTWFFFNWVIYFLIATSYNLNLFFYS